MRREGPERNARAEDFGCRRPGVLLALLATVLACTSELSPFSIAAAESASSATSISSSTGLRYAAPARR